MRIYILIVLTLTSAISIFAQGTLKGTVWDSGGAAIAGAVVLIHWDSAGSTVGLNSNVGIKEDVVVRTGVRGDFAVSLPPGFYDLFVSSMAFTPTCRKVRILDGGTVTFDPRLQASGLVTEELGTKIIPLRPIRKSK